MNAVVQIAEPGAGHRAPELVDRRRVLVSLGGTGDGDPVGGGGVEERDVDLVGGGDFFLLVRGLVADEEEVETIVYASKQVSLGPMKEI